MRKCLPWLLPALLLCSSSKAQKIPLDHTVYDSWQHIGERHVSNDGKWIVYTIDPQQGDNELIIQSGSGLYKKSIPRGYGAVISNDSRYVIFKIRPPFKDVREAKIKKKKAEDMPKDSLGIVLLGEEDIFKTSLVKSFRAPSKGNGWIAWQLEKKTPGRPKTTDSTNRKYTDSLLRVIDSLRNAIEASSSPKKKKRNRDDNGQWEMDADGDEPGTGTAGEGTDLVLRKLENGTDTVFTRVTEYYFSEYGNCLVMEQLKDPADSTSAARVLRYDLSLGELRVISRGGNDFRHFTLSEDGNRLAFLAERDAKPRELQKFYRLWYFQHGMDSATVLVDKNTVGMRLGMTVSEFGNLSFSKSGRRLFFGVSPIQPPRDTTLVDFEHARVDIWHYNDDYLQTVQNFASRLQAARQENFSACFDLEEHVFVQLGDKSLPQVLQTGEGDGDQFIGITDTGRRVASQWQGYTLKDIYAIEASTGNRKLVKANLAGTVYPSTTGKFILWYDRKARNYFVYDGKETRNISSAIKYPLWNEESDIPEEPGNYGIMGWHQGDSVVYIYDRYDAWAVSLVQNKKPFVVTGLGRPGKFATRYIKVDDDEKFIRAGQPMYFRFQNEVTKEAGLWKAAEGDLAGYSVTMLSNGPYMFSTITKARDNAGIIYTKENFNDNPDIYFQETPGTEIKLSAINPQQANYLWGNARLFKWKALNGKAATGIVYTPEDFDSTKKYPMIIYFYEKLSQGLFDYKEPAPIRSALNVPFFVSRGYIVFMPDIEYKTGYPGQSAYDYIVSGANALVKKGWVDSKRMALQGHSWGGYQAAQLATMTPIFKAVWAGAPVANMTSAYGGIRWESGASRQFQYERTQSRIGGTLWEKLPLYLKNSPLFHLDKVTAPMVIMHNDADGAVPWYQGIEMFTALRRLGKKIWMFNYNGQGHGLSQRQDMLDYQIRMQQFFDWILKDAPPAKWITEGVPAVKKGKEWGIE